MSARFRRLVASAIAIAAAFAGVAVAVPDAAAAVRTPATPSIVSTSRDAVALSWPAVAGAPRYRVQYSTSSSMRNATYVRFTNPYAEIGKLRAATTYYFRVRAITADGTNLSSYSSARSARTRAADSYTLLSPSGLTVSEATTNSLALTWTARSADARYRVSWSTTADFRDPSYVRVTGTTRTLTGLTPGRKYYVKVRAIDAAGANLSSYSPAVTAATSPTPPAPSPSGLAVTAAARTAVALRWTPVDGAEGYRVQYSTSSSMAGAQYRRSTSPSTELSGLSAGTSYYFRVRVITSDGTNRSPYSAAVKGRTATSTLSSYLPPTGLAVVAKASSKAEASWSERADGLSYELVYADNAALTDATTIRTTDTSVTITGLSASTRYWMTVRVVAPATDGSVPLSPTAPPASLTTPESAPSTLRVASYNVKCANCYSALPNEGTWYARRQAVVDAIRAQRPDVIGIQEASQAWLKADDGTGKPTSLSQFEDLVQRLGSPYKLTNTHRNNCVRSTTPTDCVYKDQGASQGTKIIYNSATLSLVSQGSRRLSELRASDNDRYVAWAILEQRATGKRFFFADTHLEHVADPPGVTTYHALRITQTRELLAEVARHAAGLPTYVVGDFNSNKWTSPSNGPYDTMRAAGFVDPLGNTYRSTSTAPGATVEHRIRTNFSSFNGYNRRAPVTSYINGTYLDYIWTSKGIAVPEWETVVAIDPAGNFTGTIPSDHNLLRATTELP